MLLTHWLFPSFWEQWLRQQPDANSGSPMQQQLFPVTEALVIIDMQIHFCTSEDESTQKACIREIKRAKRRNMPIIFLEYEGFGATQPDLMQALGVYKKVKTLTKSTDSGSDEISSLLLRQWTSIQTLRICGVNAGACVISTIRGLQWGKKFELIAVADAINCLYAGKEDVYRIVEGYKIPIVFSHSRAYMRRFAA